MYSKRLLVYFHSRKFGGDLTDATHTGIAGIRGQGPCLELWFNVRDGVITEARWKAYGCPAIMACCEVICERMVGSILSELMMVSPATITEWLDGIPEGKEHFPTLAAF